MSFKNVVNKKYIIKSELKRKFIMIYCQGPLICYALVIPEALLVTQTRYFSQFFPRFFVVYAEFVYEQMYLILNSDICSLLVRIECVALKRE